MTYHKLHERERRDIAEMYEGNLYSQRELAELYGVSRTTIRRCVEEFGKYSEKYEWPTLGLPDDTIRPTLGEVGQMDMFDSAQSEPSGPPEWLGIGLFGLAILMAGFVAWAIINGL